MLLMAVDGGFSNTMYIGSFSLRILYDTFGTGIHITGWKVGKLMKAMFKILDESPARRELVKSFLSPFRRPDGLRMSQLQIGLFRSNLCIKQYRSHPTSKIFQSSCSRHHQDPPLMKMIQLGVLKDGMTIFIQFQLNFNQCKYVNSRER